VEKTKPAWRLQRLGFRLRTCASAPLYLALFSFAVSLAARAGTAVSTTAPIAFTGTNFCVVPAEDFVGSGYVHLVLSSNLSTSGMVQSHLQANLQGFQARAIASGTKYQVPDSSTESYEFDALDLAPFHTTFEFMVQFIRVGEDGTYLFGDDFYEHFLAHATVNANGIVTVDDFTDDTRCQ
jgi:hypothetical protein